MSHFAGLVILTPEYRKNHDIEDALAPYDENMECEEYCCGKVNDIDKVRFVEYYDFDKLGKDNTARESFYLKLLKEKKVKRWNGSKDGSKSKYCSRVAYENPEEYAEFFKELHPDLIAEFDSLYEENGNDWNSNNWRKNEDGEWCEYSTYNPQSVYDWYDIDGGRWGGCIKTKSGDFVNKCLISEIDLSDFNDDDYKEEILTDFFGNRYKPLKDGVEWHFTKSNMPYCIFIDGKHFSKGKMGWFGVSDDNYDECDWNRKAIEYLNDLPKNSECYLVDFHI
jgi:hypothetical protein